MLELSKNTSFHVTRLSERSLEQQIVIAFLPPRLVSYQFARKYFLKYSYPFRNLNHMEVLTYLIVLIIISA